MTTNRVHRIVAGFERGEITEVGVCADLIDLAGIIGGDAVIRALPSELITLLREHSLVSQPPVSPDDVLIIESYCGPARSAEEWERIDRERRATAHRGAWELHRALQGVCGGGG